MHELWVCATISSRQVSTKRFTFGAYQEWGLLRALAITPTPKLPLQESPTCGLSMKWANQQMGTLQVEWTKINRLNLSESFVDCDWVVSIKT